MSEGKMVIEFQYDDLNEEYAFSDWEWSISTDKWRPHLVTASNKRGWLIVEQFTTIEAAFKFCEDVVKLKSEINYGYSDCSPGELAPT